LDYWGKGMENGKREKGKEVFFLVLDCIIMGYTLGWGQYQCLGLGYTFMGMKRPRVKITLILSLSSSY